MVFVKKNDVVQKKWTKEQAMVQLSKYFFPYQNTPAAPFISFSMFQCAFYGDWFTLLPWTFCCVWVIIMVCHDAAVFVELVTRFLFVDLTEEGKTHHQRQNSLSQSDMLRVPEVK